MEETMTDDPLKLHRETITISDDREMNLYTFELDGETMPEMQAKDVVQVIEPGAKAAE